MCRSTQGGEGGRPCECVRLVAGGTGREGLLARKADKAALCAGLESRVRPAEVWRKEMIARVLDFLAGNPLSALRAVRKERHPEMSCARSRPGLRPSGGFVAYLAVDRQMTPTSPGPLIGPAALPRPSASARLSGSASRTLRPCALRALWVREVVASVGQGAPDTLFRFEQRALLAPPT